METKKQKKINETKIWLFEKIRKLINLQPDSLRNKEAQISKIINERGKVTTNISEIKTITRNIYKAADETTQKK